MYTFETKHFSHICIVPASRGDSSEAIELVSKKVSETLPLFPMVEENPNFRCHLITEIGLMSECPKQLKQISNELAVWAQKHDLLDLIQ